MTDRLTALLAQAPGLERASRLEAPHLDVLDPFQDVLPDRGLRFGTTTSVAGIAATSIALALVAKASRTAWTAAVGLPSLGLRAGAELGVDLDHLVVVADPGTRWTDVLAALVDAFDVVLACPPPAHSMKKVGARVRERDAVLVTIGNTECDLHVRGTASRWHGVGAGHGHLAARSLDVVVTGRRSGAVPRHATLWLPDANGEVALATPSNVIRLAQGVL